MVTKTIHSVVKEVLNEADLTIHKYVKILYFILDYYQRFPMKYRELVKQRKITVNSYKRAAIPEDLMGVVDVSMIHGERIVSLFREDSLIKLYNKNSEGNKIPWPEAETDLLPEQYSVYTSDGTLVNPSELSKSFNWYGLSIGSDYAFMVDRQNRELVFTNRLPDSVELIITYSTDNIKTTDANVVDLVFSDTLKKYALMMYAKRNTVPKYEVNELVRDWKNSKKALKAHLEPITYAGLMNVFRKGIHAGLKN